MDCKKCSGLMSYEGFYGSESDTVWYYPGWRCVHCGEVVDSVIALNRKLNDSLHNLNGGVRHKNGNGHEKGNYQSGFSKQNERTRGFVFKMTGVAHQNTAAESESYERD